MAAGSLLAAVFSIPLLGLPAQGAGNSYYVSSTGSDSSTGSSTAPFRQIRKALAVVKPGDTVYVADGSYLGFNADNLLGTAAAPITIKAQGKNVQVTPTTDRSDNRDNISVNFSAYLVFDGINSSNAPRSGIRINTSNGVTVRNGVYGNNAYWGIFTGHSDDLLLEYNDCFGSQIQHGIYTSNSGDRPVVRYNRLHDNAGCGLHMNGDLSSGGDGIISGALVEGNVIYNNGLVGNAGSAINMDGVQDSIIRNNLAYNNHGRGIVGFQMDGAQGPKGLKILNNTVSMASDGRWCIQLTQTAGVNTVRNSILYHPSTSLGGILVNNSTDLTNLDSDYNMLDRATATGGSAISLTQWQALGQDAHSTTIGTKTLFVNAAGGDFHLATNSAAIDKGTTLSDVTQDLEKNPRPSGAAYDLGSYELSSGTTPVTPTAPAAPTGLTATAGDGQVALSWTASSSTGVTGYYVYASSASSGPFTKKNSTPLSGTNLTLTGLTNGATYWFNVTAVNSSNLESAASSTVQGTPTAPAATTYSISGSVTLNGAGVSGATVSAGSYTCTTSSTGSYTLVSLPSGTYSVNASVTGCQCTAQSVTVGPNKTGVNFTAQPTTTSNYTISGIVALANGTPLQGATVTVNAKDYVTGVDGAYSATVPAGTYKVTVQEYMYSFSAAKSVTVGPSKSGVNFTATPLYEVQGQVLINGKGVSGVVVKCGGLSQKTNNTGNFYLRGVPAGPQVLTATKTGYTFPQTNLNLTTDVYNLVIKNQ